MSLTKGALIQPQGLTATERDLLSLSGGDVGRLIYNETTSTLQQWTGSAWIDVLTGAAGGTNVSSVFGRSGAVVATEGDYTLTQLGDVALTTPVSGHLLQYTGTQWVNVALNTVAGVTSVFGRTGAIVATEGDYDLNDLGDVSVTGAAVGSMLELGSGGQWVPVTEISGGTF